mgnify:CR=1 FL=1
MNRKVKIGTRGSLLSLRQAELVAESLKKIIDWEFEIVKIKTKGDKIIDSPLYQMPGKGFFIKEIEDELIKGNIDIAVHSMKDLPTELPAGLEIAAVLKRDPPNDATLGLTIDEILKHLKTKTIKNIKIGTSSLRRQAQIRNILKIGKNTDVEILPLRGNIDTRLRKVENREVDCAVVAYCGFLRMGWHSNIKEVLDDEFFIPSASQGAIAVECRTDSELKTILKSLDDKDTAREVYIEREIVRLIGGGCNVPLGVRAKCDGDKTKVIAGLFSLDGERSVIVKKEIKKDGAIKEIVDEILQRGGREILNLIRVPQI